MSNPRKPIFDAVIAAVKTGNPFNVPGRVAQLDALLDDWGVPRAEEAAPGAKLTSRAGIDLIHSFEGYATKLPDGSAKAYPDPATGGKPWTIGWGSTTDENGKPIAPGTVWTRDRADSRFAKHLAQFEAGVREGLKGAPTTQAQFDAMVSLAYNIGVGAFQGSTLLRKHRAGDYAGAKAEFLRWNRAGGKVMKGLTRRREAEAKMYGGG